MSALSPMQRRYIWLAGSYPKFALVQGLGYRTQYLKYTLNEDVGQVIVFGYQNPAYFLEGRGLLRKLQSRNHYTLTDEGESAFRGLLVAGAGIRINTEIELVRERKS